MNKIPISQIEVILMQKRDLRKKWCCCTHLVAAKVSNTKGFIDRSRSVSLFDPLTRGLKELIYHVHNYPTPKVSLFDPLTRGLKASRFQLYASTWGIVSLFDPLTRGLKDKRIVNNAPLHDKFHCLTR